MFFFERVCMKFEYKKVLPTKKKKNTKTSKLGSFKNKLNKLYLTGFGQI